VLELLLEQVAGRWPVLPVSAEDGRGLDELGRFIFERLEVVRVYTRPPGREADLSRPVIIPLGSTLEDLAESLPVSFAGKIRFAKVWGSGKFDGQRVSRDYTPRDGDIVELHA
jgi:ribosome-interacting GTPase 1